MFNHFLKLPFDIFRDILGFPLLTNVARIARRESNNLQRMASNSVTRDIERNRTRRSPSNESKPNNVKSSKPAQGSSRIHSARNSSSAPVDMSGELAQFVKDAISQDQVVIFSKTYCPYCTMAKDVFKKMEKPFTVIELDKRSDGNGIQDILKEMTGARTVPRVFLNGECIGGGTDVQALYDNGTLQTMIVKKV